MGLTSEMKNLTEELSTSFKKQTNILNANNLEDKVLNYINEHPINGVKISEMEGPFGETRMKLGYLAKVLLEEGKVKKIENFYFPLR